MDYIEPLITCDKILDLFTSENAQSAITNESIYQSLKGTPNAIIVQALSRLTDHDKYLDKTVNDYYKLSGITQQFIASGKYKGWCDRIKKENENLSQKELLEIEQIKNVITTSKAVVDNFESQKITTYVSVGVGILSLIFIGISTYFQATDRTPKEVQMLRDTIIVTQKKLQKIESSLQEINSSIQKPKTDTVFLKQK